VIFAGAAVLGLLLALACLSRIEIGTTWWEWRSASVPAWLYGLQIALVAMFIAGWFVPADLGALLIGIPVGFCVAPFVIGIRRWLARGPRPETHSREREDDEEPPRPYWQSALITIAWAAPVGAILGVVLDRTAGDVIALAVVCPVTVLITDAISSRIRRWSREHDLE
jgi:hypothetical protein